MAAQKFPPPPREEGARIGDWLYSLWERLKNLFETWEGSTLLSSGIIKSTSTIDGIGYATGAGGAVTQSTSKSTTVDIDRVCGSITTHNATLNAGVAVSFTVTNDAVVATDAVIVNIKSGGTAAAYSVIVDAVAAGSFRISIRNVTAGNLGEAIVLNFAIIKAVTS